MWKREYVDLNINVCRNGQINDLWENSDILQNSPYAVRSEYMNALLSRVLPDRAGEKKNWREKQKTKNIKTKPTSPKSHSGAERGEQTMIESVAIWKCD